MTKSHKHIIMYNRYCSIEPLTVVAKSQKPDRTFFTNADIHTPFALITHKNKKNKSNQQIFLN